MIEQEIDEVIEESYLLSLPDTEVRQYLHHFLEACDNVLRRNISIWNDTRIIGVKITLLKIRLLLRDGSVPLTNLSQNTDGADKTRHSVDSLVEQVITTKHLIVNLLNAISPKLAEDILDEEKRLKLTESKDRKRHHFYTAACYFLLYLLTIALFILFIMS